MLVVGDSSAASPDTSGLLTSSQAARLLGVRPRTIRWYARTGTLSPVPGDLPHRLYFRREDVATLAEERNYLTVAEIASRLGLHESRVYRSMETWGIRPRGRGGVRRYDPDAITRMLLLRTAWGRHSGFVAAGFLGMAGCGEGYRGDVVLTDDDLAGVVAEVASALYVNLEVIPARSRYHRHVEARSACIWVLARLMVSPDRMAVLLARTPSAIRRRVAVLGINPPFAPIVAQVLSTWARRLRLAIAEDSASRHLSAFPDAVRGAATDYLRCRILGGAHADGRCSCLVGMYHAAHTGGVRDAIASALAVSGLSAHISRMDADIRGLV